MFCLDGNKFHGDRYTYLLADNWQYTEYDADWTLREKVLVRWMDSFDNIFFLSGQILLDLMIVAILFLSSLISNHAKAIFCRICNFGFKVNVTPTMLVFSPIMCSYSAAEILGRIPSLLA